MKNSLILSSLMSFFKSVFIFFATNIKDSKIIDFFLGKHEGGKISNLFKSIGERSCIISFFLSPSGESNASGSVILGFFGKILSWFRNLAAKWIIEPAKNSRIVCFFAGFYKDILNYSLRVWGIIICTGAVVYAIMSLVMRTVTTDTVIITGAVLIFGAAVCGIRTSAYNFFTGSVAVRMASKFFGDLNFEDRDTVYLNKKSTVLCCVIGTVIAVVSALIHPIYALLFAVGIPVAGWIIYDYTIGIFIAVVALAVAPTMALVGLIMFTFLSFMLNFARDNSMRFTRTAMDIPIMFFAGVLVISAVTSFDIITSAMAVMVYLAFILSYYLLTNSIHTKERLYALIVCVLVVGLFVAGYGIYQHIFGFERGTVWTDTSMFEDIETRVVSTFENPNVLGEYLLLLIPISLGMIIGIKKNSFRFVHLVILAALSLCMIYTYSRGNWIGLMVAIFIFFALYDKRFLWLAVAGVLVSPLFLPQNVINRIASVGDMGDSSTSYRVYIWIGTLKMLKDYWFCGIGIGTEAFDKIYSKYALSAITAPHSHNLYLQIITENGVLGVVTFASMMAMYFKQCIGTVIKCKDKLLRVLIIGLSSGMLGYLVQGVFDNVWYNYRVFLLFFVILGITGVCIEVEKNRATEVTKC